MPGIFTKKRGQKELPFCSCVIVAAGSSARMGEDKMMMSLGGAPLIVRTLQAIDRCACIHEIILVTNGERVVEMAKLCREYDISKVSKIMVGGETRLESVLTGIMEISGEAVLAAIHDGARPFITADVLESAVYAASEKLAAAPAVPLKDTIKHVNKYGEADGTPVRSQYMAVQTPQVFDADLIKAALTAARESGLEFTDDCSAVEALGVKPVMTFGSEENIKITSPFDMVIAEAIFSAREYFKTTENGGRI